MSTTRMYHTTVPSYHTKPISGWGSLDNAHKLFNASRKIPVTSQTSPTCVSTQYTASTNIGGLPSVQKMTGSNRHHTPAWPSQR